jgi:hypothetical protein
MAKHTEPESLWQLLPVLVAGGVAALLGYQLGRAATRTNLQRAATRTSMQRATANPSANRRTAPTELRNAGLTYRPLGETGTPYPPWVRALKGKSGVYVIRETKRDGSSEIVYVGESHRGRLYNTLTRHFQTWRRSKKFWTGQYGGQGHDPGLTYPRNRVTVAVRVLSPQRAVDEEARLIARLRPRDNLLGQPTDDVEEVIPF